MGQRHTNLSIEKQAVEISMPHQNCTGMKLAKPPYILVVTRNGHMAEPVMDYAVNVAERMKCSILAAHINTLPFYRDGGRRSTLFTAAMQESMTLFEAKARGKNVAVEHIGDAGKIGKAIKRLCHSERRIEFVVIDQGIKLDEVTADSPVPVFTVNYPRKQAGLQLKTFDTHPPTKGVHRMSTASKKRHLQNCLVFGGLTAALYAAVFTNQEVVMTYFTKGGVFALLPVSVVFGVSYFHGNFTSSFWSALGIEGSTASAGKKAEVRKEADTAPVRKDTRPRAQVNA
jgi:hypothetical protein